MTSLKVTEPSSLDSFCRRGATHSQLMTNPPTVDGKIHNAGSPQAYAAPLTPSKVQADDELAEALIAATQGPSPRPARK